MKRFFLLFIIIIISTTSCYEGTYFTFDKKLKEFYDLPENRAQIDLSDYEIKWLDREKRCYIDKPESNEYTREVYCLMQSDTFDVLLENSIFDTESGILDYYRGDTNILFFNKITGEITNLRDYLLKGKNSAWLIKLDGKMLYTPCECYYDPYNRQYKKGLIIKEASDSRVIIGFLYIAGVSMEQNPLFMTQSFYNELEMILKNKGRDELITDLNGSYEKIDPNNLNIETKERLKDFIIPQQTFYMQRVLSNRKAYLFRDNLFRTAGYTIDDIRNQNFKFGYDGRNAAVCFLEHEITLTEKTPEIISKLTPIYPEVSEYILYIPGEYE